MIGKKGADIKFDGNLNKIKSYAIITVQGYVYGGGLVKYLILLKIKRSLIKPL